MKPFLNTFFDFKFFTSTFYRNFCQILGIWELIITFCEPCPWFQFLNEHFFFIKFVEAFLAILQHIFFDSWNLKTIEFKNYLLWALPCHQWADKGLWSNQRTEQQFVHDWKQLWSCSIRGTWHPWSMSWDVAQASSTCVSSSHLQAWDGANL